MYPDSREVLMLKNFQSVYYNINKNKKVNITMIFQPNMKIILPKDKIDDHSQF